MGINNLSCSSAWQVRLSAEPTFLNHDKLNPVASSHFILKLRGQDTARRTGQDDGRYQDMNDRRQRVDRGSCFALPFLQTVAVTVPLQFGEDPENAPSSQSHENIRQLPQCMTHGTVNNLRLSRNTD